MSQTDPLEEFYTDLDDWWGQLWGNRIAAKTPNKKMKERFFRYVYNRCRDVGSFKIKDDDIGNLFSDYINYLGEW